MLQFIRPNSWVFNNLWIWAVLWPHQTNTLPYVEVNLSALVQTLFSENNIVARAPCAAFDPTVRRREVELGAESWSILVGVSGKVNWEARELEGWNKRNPKRESILLNMSAMSHWGLLVQCILCISPWISFPGKDCAGHRRRNSSHSLRTFS